LLRWHRCRCRYCCGGGIPPPAEHQAKHIFTERPTA
jgi:hypothetical protein